MSLAHQLFARAALDKIGDPELLFNPYRDFSTRYRQASLSIAAGLISRLGAASQNEFRAARTGDSVRLDDVLTLKRLVERVGSRNLKTLIDALSS